MSSFMPTLGEGTRLVSTYPAVEDVRATVLEALSLTPRQRQQVHGLMCARCPRTDGLRPAGYAYTRRGPQDSGRLAWPVRVCPDHRNTGGTQ
ncbi:hypothetical protein [Streptomyces scabiei]|uniref:hypothetical protein n=1 Tax=Streptomyces scabiei TaxID=1930 RepID=UPI0029907522|nr:hypothetical protein [Streptomyces scabiei]